ncbi:DUF1697 domain-containing protein [Labrys okinawensis]|uniref:DUF1697 domain-containing protein n=1 Tax=Labrys okinawensis TaxID=346911 RepID=UPI0039BD56EE
MATYVALLYSIVLTPQRRVAMSDLRAMAARLGFERPRTLVSTGNLVFETDQTPIAQLENHLEAAFATQFGKPVDMLVREATTWRRTVAGNPFPVESAQDGSLVALRIMRRPLDPALTEKLEPFLAPPERLAIVAGDLWVFFAGRPSESRLLGALTTRRLGIGTLRNWNTVRGLAGLLD